MNRQDQQILILRVLRCCMIKLFIRRERYDIMKRFLFVLIVVCSLLPLASCTSAIQDGLTAQNEEAISTIYDDTITNISDNEIRTTHLSGSTWAYENIDELASRATYIVRVEVLDERVESIDTMIPPASRYRIFTVNRLRVLDVFKGDTEIGNIMQVRQFGGQLGDEKVIYSGQITLPIGDDLILFLSCRGIDNRPAYLLSPTQSVYRFPASDSNDRIRSSDEGLECLVGHPNLTLTLTFDNLAQFYEAYME